ncbi:ATP-dependent helicase [Helicobacter cappadocius]|uniref:DNA 3'-5' helicase n=1 Tax=Helicobacter cappadocius TaxID=3063998 RepID=A0AA90PJV1_9HELI|nr:MULTISPECIES: UvrD-helicase domain-containing protein [unclassified Helicobacter]MDO7253654.1 3'-5' exonuclease [Helicobacter sp. faydin-H75]MDP2539582.1 3'-5' exonuclease [Helicobacter sp. faydin-H76]
MTPDTLKNLNSSQLEAIKHIDGPMLILAGAGSGKTKTLTTRLAYLIDEVGIPATSTLTLTFTNKAAIEMRTRALNLIENISNQSPPLLCTFHKFGLLFLKFNIHLLNRKSNFVLIDGDDKKKILKGFKPNLPIGYIESNISNLKNFLISPVEALSSAQNDYQKEVAKLYKLYEDFLNEKNMVDFDDLLVLTYKILDANPELAKNTSNQYQYIMVDEYQDTNRLQYKLLMKLCSTHQNLCVVGDDDQSIYGWRGADITNILNFKDNFENVKIIKLQENYRSTTQILKGANSLINYNKNRLGKELQSIKGNGKAIQILHSENETQEATLISTKIKQLLKEGINPSKIAVLFRVNALSRSIEAGFNRAEIPYKIIGAIRFYERSEIKDILSYLRLIINPNDDFSLSRIINKPKRGIGKTTQDKIFQTIQNDKISVYQALKEGRLKSIISAKNHKTLEEFFSMIDDFVHFLSISPMRFIDEFTSSINLIDESENSNDSIDRLYNIEEFYGMFKDYIIQSPENSLEDFLNDLSLSSDNTSDDGSYISCMSVHSAKGLEFEYVFITGFEEGFFPLVRDESDIEEERRLGYVAFTRAKDELYISYVDSRFYRGERSLLEKSRFLKEAGLLEEQNTHSKKEEDFKKGDIIFHKIFGSGRIIDVQKIGSDTKLRISFGGLERDILSSFVQKG